MVRNVRRTKDSSRPLAPRAAQLAVLVLALATVGLTVRAALTESRNDLRDVVGRFGPEVAGRARALLARLARGILVCQEEDGGFRADDDPSSQHNDDAERVAASALAATALAQMVELGIEVPGLRPALSRARAYLRARQTERGAVLGTVAGAIRLQVEATAGAAWTWLLAREDEDTKPLREAGAALRRMGKDGFENGYPRALVAMFAERVARQGREATVLEGQPRDLVRWREQKVLPTEGGFELWDTSLAEAIARTTLGQMTRQQGAVDPFPLRVLKAILATPPDWSGASSDVQGWWLQAWIVARSRLGAAWFVTLLDVLTEWSDEASGLVPDSYYASAVVQTAAAAMAIAEGLLAEPATR